MAEPKEETSSVLSVVSRCNELGEWVVTTAVLVQTPLYLLVVVTVYVVHLTFFFHTLSLHSLTFLTSFLFFLSCHNVLPHTQTFSQLRQLNGTFCSRHHLVDHHHR